MKKIKVQARLANPRENPLTVGDWLTQWLENYARPGVRPSTFEIYQAYLNNHLLPHLGTIPLKQLSATKVQLFLRQLQTDGSRKETGKGLAPSTIINIRNLLKAALEQAVVEGKLDYNPVRQTRPPKSERPPMNILSPEELARFLQGAVASPYYAAYVLALTTGMRRGELLGVTWNSIALGPSWAEIDKLFPQIAKLKLWDTEGLQRLLKRRHITLRNDPCVTIVQQLSDLHSGPQITLPKTRYSQRSICIPADTALILIFQRSLCRERNSDLVFCSSNGLPVDPRSFTRRFQKDLSRVEVKQIRFHDMRHTVATILLEDGKALNTVQEILGHYNAAFTAAQYGHVTTRMHKEATDTLGLVLKRARESNKFSYSL